MNGPIAQAAALVAYGNEHLLGRAWAEFWPGANVFKYCKFVRFTDGSHTAADPHAWFAALKTSGVSGLRLHYVAGKQAIGGDRELSAFVGGGGRWLIEAVARADSAIWEAAWRAGPKDEHGAIWDVEAHCIQQHWPRPPLHDIALDTLRVRVGATLEEISSFAKAQSLAFFANAFDQARAALDSTSPLSAAWGGDFAHTTLLPVAAQQLLGAAAAGWMFGGMGSWNDQGFESAADTAEYKRLSDMLWALLCESICASVNAAHKP